MDNRHPLPPLPPPRILDDSRVFEKYLYGPCDVVEYRNDGYMRCKHCRLVTRDPQRHTETCYDQQISKQAQMYNVTVPKWQDTRPYAVRARQLGLERWRDEVQSKLFHYMHWDSRDPDALRPAADLLVKYERLERIALLELAVWRASCLTVPVDTVKDYFDMLEWLQEGWKTKKYDMWRCNSVVIVIQQVLPFLEES